MPFGAARGFQFAGTEGNMNRSTFLLMLTFLTLAAAASATTLSCTVTSGTVLVGSTNGGYLIPNGIGSNSSAGAGTISCPGVGSTNSNTVYVYKVFAEVSYQGTFSSIEAIQILTLVGGPNSGSSQVAVIVGTNNVAPVLQIQLGPTLVGLGLFPSFMVNVASSVSSIVPIATGTLNRSTIPSNAITAGSIGQVFVSYEIVPEPSTWLGMSSGLLGLGLLFRRTARNQKGY
jgi:hypothetical protein